MLEQDFNLGASPLTDVHGRGHDLQVRFPRENGNYELTIAPVFGENSNFSSDYYEGRTRPIKVALRRNPDMLFYLAGVVLVTSAVIFGTLALVLRRRFRLRLSTCLGMLMVTAVLLAVNAQVEILCSDYPAEWVFSVQGAPGWPWPASDGMRFPAEFWMDALVFMAIVAASACVLELFPIRRVFRSIAAIWHLNSARGDVKGMSAQPLWRTHACPRALEVRGRPPKKAGPS